MAHSITKCLQATWNLVRIFPQTQTASGIDLMSRKEAMKIILEWNLVTDLIQGTRAIVEAFLN